MKSQTNKLWPRVLSLVLSLSLVAGLMPAALASSPHQHTSQCPKELSCTYKDFPVDPTNPTGLLSADKKRATLFQDISTAPTAIPMAMRTKRPLAAKKLAKALLRAIPIRMNATIHTTTTATPIPAHPLPALPSPPAP